MSTPRDPSAPGQTDTVIVVPCHNEARRLLGAQFECFVRATEGVRFVFVNDGSTDQTLDVLRDLESCIPMRMQILDLSRNVGKGEAIRAGLQRAFELEASYCGFWDADLATPLEAILDFCTLLDERPDIEMVFGTRVHLLGRDIQRHAFRHYLGRVAATVISLALGLRVYDTQCGAKLFRVTPELRALFDEPFTSSWIFDVEIIARLIAARRAGGPGADRVLYEYPLTAWRDVEGSNVRPWDYARAAGDLVRIYRRYLRT
jgi:glycosyltransferase involved in cell wall biosynthesis